MKVNIFTKDMKVSPYLNETVEKKLNKIEHYFHSDAQANVTLSVEKTRQICEITIPIKGATLRAKDVSGDMYASIDGVIAKIERQIRKHRTRLEKRIHENAFQQIPDGEEEPLRKIVRSKQFALKPMDVEEAILQMELLDHSFYVFMNADSGNTNVLYLREDGDLGLIEPA